MISPCRPPLTNLLKSERAMPRIVTSTSGRGEESSSESVPPATWRRGVTYEMGDRHRRHAFAIHCLKPHARAVGENGPGEGAAHGALHALWRRRNPEERGKKTIVASFAMPCPGSDISPWRYALCRLASMVYAVRRPTHNRIKNQHACVRIQRDRGTVGGLWVERPRSCSSLDYELLDRNARVPSTMLHKREQCIAHSELRNAHSPPFRNCSRCSAASPRCADDVRVVVGPRGGRPYHFDGLCILQL